MFKCPHCGTKGIHVDRFTYLHPDCEVLFECLHCRKYFKVIYKVDKVIKLEEKELKV